jgi:putative tryptophan/tyrosine transport system substrate-binding protein
MKHAAVLGAPHRRACRVLLAAVLCLSPLLAAAQQPGKIHRIGWLGHGSPDAPSPYFDALRQGLAELGYVEGKTHVFERRWWGGGEPALRALADELVAAKPDVLVAQGPTGRGFKDVTAVPVVIGVSGDPVAAGLTPSLARPGNLTGATFMAIEINGKRVELLRETLPEIARIGLLSNPTHPGEPQEVANTQAAARQLGLELFYVQARTAAEIAPALESLKASRVESIMMLPDGLLMQESGAILGFATQQRIPVVSGWSAMAEAGALMTYGPNLNDSWRRLAIYVDKILKGAKPADLPIEQPTHFELVVNLKAAKALGVSVPASVLARADRLIE